jgi:hypothetical protein
MKNLIISELEQAQESKEISSIVREVIGVFLAAINDWPNPILKLEDYNLEVKSFIGGEVTKHKISLTLSQIDVSKNSWQAESLSQLSDVFKFYNEGVSLKEIIIDLEMKLENESGA